MPTRDALLGLGWCLAIACIFPACRRETRQFEGPSYLSANALGVRVDVDASAEHTSLPAPGTPGPYVGNAWAMGQGQQLYNQMNCVGCHSHGGGGMGPPLMDAAWIYGVAPDNVYASIMRGRPNGMPAFGGRVTESQAWQLVAYVRSLSGQPSRGARPGRDDHMQVRESEQARRAERPVAAGTPKPGP